MASPADSFANGCSGFILVVLSTLYYIQLRLAYKKGNEKQKVKLTDKCAITVDMFECLENHDDGYRNVWAFTILAVLLPVFLNSMSDLRSIISFSEPIYSNPPEFSSLQRTLDRLESQELAGPPEFRALARSSEFRALAQSSEFRALAQSLEFQELLQSPEFREVVQSREFEEQDFLALLLSPSFRESPEFRLRPGLPELLESPEFRDMAKSAEFREFMRFSEFRETVLSPELRDTFTLQDLLRETVSVGEAGRTRDWLLSVAQEARKRPQQVSYKPWPSWFYFLCLVPSNPQIVGYNRLSLTRASELVNCQSILPCRLLRSRCQAVISSCMVVMSARRRLRH